MTTAKQEKDIPVTVPDNSQHWAGMDGAIAWHLIECHADGWADIRKMMGEWLAANVAPSNPEFTGAARRPR